MNSVVQFDCSTRPLQMASLNTGGALCLCFLIWGHQGQRCYLLRAASVWMFKCSDCGRVHRSPCIDQLTPRKGGRPLSLSQRVKALCFLTSSCPAWGPADEFSAVVLTFLVQWCHRAQASNGRGPWPACRGSGEDALLLQGTPARFPILLS